MNTAFIFIGFLCQSQILFSESRSLSNKWRNYPNSRPIIGILAQEVANSNSESPSGGVSTYIAASYVKFVEAGGARVVPIHLNRTKEYLSEILDSINGVLIPGGSAPLNDSMYATTGNAILNYAIQKNDAGESFPIWATCLGFELLANFLAPNYDNLVDCNASNIALPLTLEPDASQSRLFSDLPSDILQSFAQNVTANYHHKCLTRKTVADSSLDKQIKILSTSFDSDNLEFVSTYETIKYPFYAVQWHPEKAPWEWNTDETNLPHLPEAIRVTQYFALFLANEGRKNTHHFKKPAREVIELIYNIHPDYTGKNGSHFEQQYVFNSG